MIKLMVVEFCYIVGEKTTLADGCGIWKHFYRFRKVKYLQQCSKTLRMGIKSSRIIGLVAEDGIALMAASSQIGNPGSILIGNQFSSLLL